MATSLDSFKSRRTLTVGGASYDYFSLPEAEKNGLAGISRLPFSLKVLLENLLRFEDGRTVTADDIRAMADWLATRTSDREIAFRPARVLMQDFTGVPAVVDLAAMRDAMAALGGDPARINPLVPVDLVIDHSVMVDDFGAAERLRARTSSCEYERNGERYAFLRWGQSAFEQLPRRAAGHRHLPPGQPRIPRPDRLDRRRRTAATVAYPDTLVGTDSHTTMINGLAVLGWGVGGIEAEAAMLGQPISMLIPEVIGFTLTGRLTEGVTATDLVLTVTEMLRKKGVVGKFVEFYGAGLAAPVARGPRHHRQHGAGIRRHLRLLPGRRGDARLPQGDRPRPDARRAGRGLRQGAGPVPHRRHARPGLHRHAGARPRHRRARRSPARSARRTACRCPAPTPPSMRRSPSFRDINGADARLRHGRGGRRLGAEPPTQPPRSRARTTSWPTATWSSPRSPPAPTPPTRAC